MAEAGCGQFDGDVNVLGVECLFVPSAWFLIRLFAVEFGGPLSSEDVWRAAIPPAVGLPWRTALGLRKSSQLYTKCVSRTLPAPGS